MTTRPPGARTRRNSRRAAPGSAISVPGAAVQRQGDLQGAGMLGQAVLGGSDDPVEPVQRGPRPADADQAALPARHGSDAQGIDHGATATEQDQLRPGRLQLGPLASGYPAPCRGIQPVDHHPSQWIQGPLEGVGLAQRRGQMPELAVGAGPGRLEHPDAARARLAAPPAPAAAWRGGGGAGGRGHGGLNGFRHGVDQPTAPSRAGARARPARTNRATPSCRW